MPRQSPAPKDVKAVASKPAVTRRVMAVFANNLYVIKGYDDESIQRAQTEEAEGAYIIQAVNSHAALVQALKAAAGYVSITVSNSHRDEVLALIDKALKISGQEE